MSWKSGFTDRAERALELTSRDLKRQPNALTSALKSALASAELLSGIDACGPSLARGIFTALEVNVSEVVAQARLIANDRGSELVVRRLRSRSASLDMIVRRATEEAELLGHRRVGTEHLLLAVISFHDDPATCALRAAGVTQDTVRGTLRRLLLSWTDDGRPRPQASVA